MPRKSNVDALAAAAEFWRACRDASISDLEDAAYAAHCETEGGTMSHAEIAAMVGLSYGRARQLVYAGRRRSNGS